jgi:hypothetical protein
VVAEGEEAAGEDRVTTSEGVEGVAAAGVVPATTETSTTEGLVGDEEASEEGTGGERPLIIFFFINVVIGL